MPARWGGIAYKRFEGNNSEYPQPIFASLWYQPRFASERVRASFFAQPNAAPIAHISSSTLSMLQANGWRWNESLANLT